MSGPFDWSQADKEVGKLLDEGKCLICRGTGRDKVWNHGMGEWYEDECAACNGTGYYQGPKNGG